MKYAIIKKISFVATVLMVLSILLPGVAFAQTTVPAAPSGLYCVPTSGQVDVHWTDNSTDETGFNIERAPDIGGLGPGTYAMIGVAPANPGPGVDVVFTDAGVVAQKAYWYRVAAVNAAGGSFYSNETRVLTLISAPGINLEQPASGQIMSGTPNTITANTNVAGTAVTSAEYQLVGNNPPGTFDAKDVYATPRDLTILAARQTTPAPTNDPTDFSAMAVPAGAIAEFEIRGRVGAVNGTGQWQIGSPPVIVYESVTGQPQSTRFVGSRRPIAGDAVKIKAFRTLAAGPLIAKEITYIAPAPQTVAAAAVTKNFLISGALTAMTPPVTAPGYLMSGETWTVGAGKFRIDAPYFPAYVDANVAMGMNVTVRFAAMPTEANVARQIFNQVTTAIQTTTNVNPVFDYTPVPLNVPEGTWLYVIVDGVVSAKDLITGSWTIGNEGIMCYETAGVLVAPATVGDEVLVYCRRTLTPGPLVIEQVHNILPGPLIQPYKETAVQMQLMYNGTIQTMGPNNWTIAGPTGTPVTFIVDDSEGTARIDPLPFAAFSAGMPVTVEFEHVGEVMPDDASWAPMTGGPTNWSATLNPPAMSQNLSGNIFLRSIDATQNSMTNSVPVTVALMPTAAPNAPVLNSVVQTSTNQVTVTWTVASAGDAAASYTVERSLTTPGAFSSIAAPAASMTDVDPGMTGIQNSFVDTTVTSGNTYWYQVKGVNVIGAGAASNQMSVQVINVPATPTNLNAALLTATSVQLLWNDLAGNEDGYRIERAPDASGQPGTFAQVGTNLAANSTSFTDTIVSGAIWHYRVIAFSTTLGDSAPSNVAMITMTAPVPPTDITTIISASITVSWTDNSLNETGFLVERAPDVSGVSGNFTAVTGPGNPTPANATSFVDTTTVQGQTYWYRVTALGGAVPNSPPLAAPVPLSYDIPAAPTGLTLSAPSYNAVVVNWVDSSNNETGFTIQRAPDVSGVSGNFTNVSSVGMNIQSFNDATVVPSTKYYYQVLATNSLGNSATTAGPASVTTPAVPPPPVFGGGDIGPVYNTLSLTGLTGSVTLRVDSQGIVQATTVLENADKSLSLSIPSGVRLQTSTGGVLSQITLAAVTSPPAVPAGMKLVGSAYEFSPNGAKFDPGMTLTMKYATASLPAGVRPDSLQIGTWDGAKWTVLSSNLDATKNEVRATIKNFSSFAILAQAILPSVSITAPANGAGLTGNNVTVSVAVKDFKLLTPGGAVTFGEGHIHYYMDVEIPTTPGQPAVTGTGTYKVSPDTSVVWENVGAGSHRFGVQLVNNDHTPLNPPVTATVTATVVPSTPTPTATTPATTTPATTTPATTTPATTTPATTTPATTTPTATVSPTTTLPTTGETGGTNWVLIGGIIAAAIIIIALIVFFVRRRAV